PNSATSSSWEYRSNWSPSASAKRFNRLLLPLASVFAGLIDLAIGFVILVLTMIYFGVSVGWSLLYAPLFLIHGVILSVSVGTLLSALNVRFRDVKFALPFALQVWMFASPIFYPFDILSPTVQKVFALNPLTGVLLGFRSALFGSGFDWPQIATSILGTLVIVCISLFVFSRMEDDFSDMI
ncbi:MAG: ABC transporter permease, partial [Pyrinomonadaceae bacterium]